MNHKDILLLCSVLLCLSSASQAQMGRAGGMGGNSSPAEHIAPTPSDLPPEPEARAEDLRLNGKCNRAIPILRALINNGAGYEIAQYNLGLCLFDLAKVDPDAAHAASLRQEGAAAILVAANSNIPKAQSSLVSIYLDGTGIAADPIEAGKWSLIYHDNQARRMIGMPDIPSDLKARLDSTLTPKNWDVAQARADAWSPTLRNFDK